MQTGTTAPRSPYLLLLLFLLNYYWLTLACKIFLAKFSFVPLTIFSAVYAQNADGLKKATTSIARFLLEFFVQENPKVMRPLTNSNFVIDFYRFKAAPYYAKALA